MWNVLLLFVAQVQDNQMNELFHVLEILESLMNKDTILKSYDVIDDDIAGRLGHDIFRR